MEGTIQDNEVLNGQEIETTSELPTEGNQSQQEAHSLPENAAERTRKEFEKLLSSNKELKARLKELESSTQSGSSNTKSSVFENSSNVSEDMGDYVDEEGNVLIDKLNKDLRALKVSALEAKALAEDAKNTIEVEKAVSKHPYLDPADSEYDPQFTELVKDRMARLQIEGKNASLSHAADEVLKVYKPANSSFKEKEEAIAEYKKSQVAKAQVGAVNTGRNIRVDQTSEDLKRKMYSYNSADRSSAIQERLKNIGL
jgi:hypothetical protein